MSQKPSREATQKLADLIKELDAKFEEIAAHADANDLSVQYSPPAGYASFYYDGVNTKSREETRNYDGRDITGWYSSSDLC